MAEEKEKTPLAEAKELNKEINPPSYRQTKEEEEIMKYQTRRIGEMKNYRKSLKVEEEWKEADVEYYPQEISFTNSKRKRFEADQDTGLRSRLVPIGDSSQEWRSTNSEPTLLAKIQTALSIIVDRNPQGVLTALQKKFEPRTALAQSLWKRNWEVSGSKDQLKLFTFNLAKYGWAVGRTYPRIVKYDKKVLTELDTEHPENNKYETKELVWYNDVAKQNMDPFRTWIDEMTRPYDTYSTNEVYFELDFSYDAAKVEFGHYENFKFVKPGMRVEPDTEVETEDDENKDRQDIVTIGFFESRLKDRLCITVPSANIPLHTCPLPNDDGYLSLWHAMWVLRDAKSPYGISLWQIIKQNKRLYDKMQNMTMDQLVLSIMKMMFYTGSATTQGDGTIRIVPGKMQQIINGEMKFLEVPGPGQQAWEGLKWLRGLQDDASGVTPTLEGAVNGNTLGEILHAKEAALKRLKVPLENISWAIEQDAYVALSWMKQIYSTPEVKYFADINELMAYEKEHGIQSQELFQEASTPTEEVGPDGMPIEQPGQLVGSYLPQLSLHMEDREGKLVESKKSRFFQVGKDIPVEYLDWRGIFKVTPKSILAPSEELDKQRKMEVFNIVVPAIGQDPQGLLLKKPVMQVLKINEEDPEDWLPDAWLQEAEAPKEELFTDAEAMPGGAPGMTPEGAGPGETMSGKMGMEMPGTGKVVGKNLAGVGNAPSMGQGQINNMFKGLFKK